MASPPTMEVCESPATKGLQATIVGNDEGKMYVQVGAHDATPGESSGWTTTSRRMRKAKELQGERPSLTAERQSRPKERVNFVKPVTENIKKAARMPAAIPRDDHKIVIRPRGGLNVARIETPVVTDAIMAAAGTAKEYQGEDMVCINAAQNILVVSTPSEQRAEIYTKIRTVEFGNMEFEVSAYRTAPERTAKGIIRGIAIDDSPEDINEAVVAKYNPTALEAHRIGNSTAVIVLFEGQRVPRYVIYRAALLKCRLYRKHHEVCRCCGKVGHRIDVCPTPETRVRFACGEANPDADHEKACKPSCKLCGGAHPTADRICKNKFKVPFVVTKRQWERREEREQQQLQKTRPPMTSSDFPQLPSREKSECSESQRRTDSRERHKSQQKHLPPSQQEDGKLKWLAAVKGSKSKETPRSKQQPPCHHHNTGEPPVTRREIYDMINENNERLLQKMEEKMDARIDKLLEAIRGSQAPLSLPTPQQEQEVEQIPRPSSKKKTPAKPPKRKEEPAIAEKEATKSSIESDEEQPKEPSNKKRIIENTKERKLMARLDRMDKEREQIAHSMKEKFNKVEMTLGEIQRGMLQLQTQMQTFLQSMEAKMQTFVQNAQTQITTQIQQL
ncbi:hypothetical protein ISCGN_029975 [Ixodes scapularis]